ncbi:hypothetical protein [Nitrosospira sp. Is2]|nr:hypothetical protein [Nitrosospira sp. Is2]WON72926.1 hypothetical protein R5L00_10520 [Nitrosospira sp. Is2]
MTTAICLCCGAVKLGALTPCPECRFDPQENGDKAKAAVPTEHFLSQEDLNAVSERIKSGLAVAYPDELGKDLSHDFASNSGLGK